MTIIPRMDTEVLRKQIAEEVQAEYELRLREMRRLKNQAEEELENAAERWRAERRRLNAEIDRLESQSGSPAITEAAPEDLEQQIEAKLRAAAAEWEKERDRLVGQIAHLQTSVAEAIERSSNPLRATQAIRDQFEGKLSEALSQRLE